MRILVKSPVSILTLLASIVLLSSCQAVPTASSVNNNLQVKETGSGPGRHDTEIVRLNNCDGKAPTTQTTDRGQSVTIGGEASLGASGVVIQGAVSANYATGANTSKSQQLTAPPGTNMEFTIEWTMEERDGIVTKEGVNVDPATYRHFRPISVQIVSQRDLGCPNKQAVLAGSTPPSHIQSPTPVSSPDVKPNDTPPPSPTTRPTNTPAPIPTPMPKPGDLLYQADWSQGMNGWAGSSDWKTISGMLVNDGSGRNTGSTVIAPFRPGSIVDYAVEAEIQFIRRGSGASCEGPFGVFIRGDDWTGKGYGGGGAVVGGGCGGKHRLGIYRPAWQNHYAYAEKEFGIDTMWHKYRLEGQGNVIRLIVNGALYIEITDNEFLEGGQLGLYSSSDVLNIRSFKVVKL